MEDLIYEGEVSELTPLILPIAWDEALMILERVPATWLGTEGGKEGLQFRQFDQQIDFNSWQIGRIFDENRELSWRKNDKGLFQIIYAGDPLPEHADLRQLDTQGWECAESQPYLLWGTRWAAKQQEPPVFLELQIPRLLQYPDAVVANTTSTRLAVQVLLYRVSQTGQLQHYRFQRLEGAL